MKTFGVGVVGYGFMGRMHTYAYQSLAMLYEPAPAKLKMVGCAVRSPASQEIAVRQAGFEFATANYRQLLERDDIHIISCCVPNNLHEQVAVDAIRAGKHLYIDKPLAASLEQAERIVQADVDAADGRTRQMAFNYRFVPALMRARQLLQEGRLGRIYTFNLRYLHSTNADPSRPLHWKTDRAAGGGVLVDLGSHIIDLARWLLGDFRRVLAHPVTAIPERPDGKGGMQKVEGDDATFLLAEMQYGAAGTLEASKLAVGANDDLTVEIRGEKGALLFSLMEPEWLRFYDNTAPGGDLGGLKGFTAIECVQRYPAPASLPGPKLTPGWMRFHIHSVYEFVRRVAEGLPGDPSLRDGLETQRVLETCYNTPGRWTEVTER
ncbi:MAG: Gfo/Idh/MocA family protein [Armatimonadota bacterium]